MSTTRQRTMRGFLGVGWARIPGDSCTVRALSVGESGHGIEKPPCAGIIQIRFDGRSLNGFLSARFTGLP